MSLNLTVKSVLTDDQPSVEEQTHANHLLAPRTASYPYETESMAKLRTTLRCKNVPDSVIDQFKRCLNVLEREGFVLKGPHRAS
jgi:hypothetical protein